jgi:hypothetical protein
MNKILVAHFMDPDEIIRGDEAEEEKKPITPKLERNTGGSRQQAQIVTPVHQQDDDDDEDDEEDGQESSDYCGKSSGLL